MFILYDILSLKSLCKRFSKVWTVLPRTCSFSKNVLSFRWVLWANGCLTVIVFDSTSHSHWCKWQKQSLSLANDPNKKIIIPVHPTHLTELITTPKKMFGKCARPRRLHHIWIKPVESWDATLLHYALTSNFTLTNTIWCK